jgi:F-type H+-transporting ATPase subunit delta
MNKQYAKALFEIAKEDKLLQSCKESFDLFITLLDQEDDFRLLLTSPKISLETKKDLIKKSFKNVDDNLIYFIFVLLDNGRIEIVKDIYNSFVNLYNELNMIKNVVVLSSLELDSKEIKKLRNSLENYYAGYKVIIENKIDPSVIGGYHILVNGLSIDLSVKHKIDSLKSTL